MNTNELPIMEYPWIAFILATVAGLLNGFTYYEAGIFGTLQSGNIILLGQHISLGDWTHVYDILIMICAFGLGSMATVLVQVIEQAKRKVWSIAILLIEVVTLTLLATGIFTNLIGMFYICATISFIAGVQGNGFHKLNGISYGNIAVTPVLQSAFNYLMHFICGDKKSFKTGCLFFLVLIGFASGGSTGFIVAHQIHEKTLFIPAALLMLLVIYAQFMAHEGKNYIDPT